MREYPRFLYSNSTNTKSPGEYIVHTIYPKALAKVIKKNGVTRIEFLEIENVNTPDAIEKLRNQILAWYINSILSAVVNLDGIPLYQAFDKMIHTRAIHSKINCTSESIRTIRFNIKSKIYPTINRMHELLQLAGWKCVSDEIWQEG